MSVCKHLNGFKFLACTAADRLPGVFVCRDDCGYMTRTNPETGITYTEGPDPNREWKTPQKMENHEVEQQKQRTGD